MYINIVEKTLSAIPLFVHDVADFTNRSYRLRVGRIVRGQQSDLIILTISATGRRLVHVLKPMRTDEVLIVKRRPHIFFTQVSHLYKIIENQRKKTGKVVII